jgi:hypothetical protein
MRRHTRRSPVATTIRRTAPEGAEIGRAEERDDQYILGEPGRAHRDTLTMRTDEAQNGDAE